MDSLSKCPHCGAYHDWKPENCMAVKKISYRGYVYGPNGGTVSHPGIESIEYVSLEEQLELRRLNGGLLPPNEEILKNGL